MPALSLEGGRRSDVCRVRGALSSVVGRNWERGPGVIIGWPVHVVGLVVGLVTQVVWRGTRENGDWAALWIAGKLLRQGDGPHIYDFVPDDFAAWAGPFWAPFVGQDVTAFSPHPFVQAPFVAQLAEVLTFVTSFRGSVFLMTVASGWALVVLVASAFYVWCRRPIPWGLLAGVVLVVWLSTPFQWSITLGQTTPLVMAGVAYSIAAARDRPWLAGVWLGLVSVVKLTPLVLIPLMLLFRRSRRASLVAIATAVVCGVFSVVTVGWSLHGIWRARIHTFSTFKVIAPTSQTLVSIMKRHVIGQGPAGAPTVGDAPGWMVALPMVVAAVVALVLALAAYRCRERAFEIVVVGAICVATCFSGFVWTHYFLISVLPAFGVWALMPWRRWAVAGLVMVSVFYFPPLSDVVSPEHRERFFVQAGLYCPGGPLLATVVLLVMLAVAVLVPGRRVVGERGVGRGYRVPSGVRVPWGGVSVVSARGAGGRGSWGSRGGVVARLVSSSEHIVGRAGHIVAVVSGLITVLAWNSHRQTDDWSSLWIAGKLVAQGNEAHIYDYDHHDFARWSGEYWAPFANEHVTSFLPHPFVQAPVVAEAVSVLTHIMSYGLSTVLLGFFSGWAMVITVACAYRMWVGRTIPVVVLLPVVVVVWVSAPFSMAVFLGQTSTLIYAGIAYAIAAARVRPRSAGVVLGVVSIVKLSPFALVVAMFLFRRSRMTASIAAVTTVVGFVLSVVTAGFGAFRTWIQVIHTLSSSRIVALESQSFASIMMRDRRNDNPHVLVPIVTDPPMWVVVIPLIVAFLLAVLVLIAAYERRDYAFPLMMVGITSIATACSGLVWTHYFQVALLPACGALALAVRRRLAGFLVMCLGLFFVPPLADVAGSTVHAKVHVVPGGLIALIGLILVMCVMALWRAPVRSRRRLGVNQWWEAYDGGGRGLELSSASLPRRYRRDLTGSLPVAAGASWLVRRRHGAL